MSEPRTTLYTPNWSEARARINTMEPHTRPVFVSLLDHMERGWQAFRPLQAWYEENHARAKAERDDYAKLLAFVDAELSDVFLMVGVGVADLVPGRPEWVAEADPLDLDGWVHDFGRNLSVLRLACAAADVPEEFRALSVGVVGVLETGEWVSQLSALLGAAGELVPLD